MNAFRAPRRLFIFGLLTSALLVPALAASAAITWEDIKDPPKKQVMAAAKNLTRTLIGKKRLASMPAKDKKTLEVNVEKAGKLLLSMGLHAVEHIVVLWEDPGKKATREHVSGCEICHPISAELLGKEQAVFLPPKKFKGEHRADGGEVTPWLHHTEDTDLPVRRTSGADDMTQFCCVDGMAKRCTVGRGLRPNEPCACPTAVGSKQGRACNF